MNEFIDHSKNTTITVDIKDKKLESMYIRGTRVIESIQNIRDYSFTTINKSIEKIDEIESEYKEYRKGSNRQIMKMVLKDKIVVMIIVMMIIIVAGAIVERFV